MLKVNILQKISSFLSLRREATGSQDSDPAALTAALRVIGNSTNRVVVSTADGAMRLSVVYSCVQYISNAVANMRCMYQKKDTHGVYKEDFNNSLHYLLTVQPNDDYNAHDFWQRVVTLVLLSGNAYIYPKWDIYTGQLEALILLEDGSVFYDRYTRTYNVSDAENGINAILHEDEIIHLKNIVIDGKVGVGVISYAMYSMGVVATAKKEVQNRFANGGNIRGIVGNNTSVTGFGQYQKEQLGDVAVDIDTKFMSGKHIVSLPGDVKFTPISLSSTDMQFLETYKFSSKELCQFFGVPTVLVTGESSSTYKSLTEARLAFLSQTLDPMLKKIENELMRKLISKEACGKCRFLFDRSAIYDTDLISRAKYQMQTIQTGLYTINEWRTIENKPTVEGGDVPLVSANLKGLQQLLNGNDSTDTTSDNKSDDGTELEDDGKINNE